MADMNAVPLGYEQSDSVGGTENQADDVQFDFVLENSRPLNRRRQAIAARQEKR